MYSRSVNRKRVIRIFEHFLGINPFDSTQEIQYGYDDSIDIPDDVLLEFLRNLCNLERALLFPEGLSHRENSNYMIKSLYSDKKKKYIPNALKELLLWSVLTEETELTDIFLTHRTEYGLHDRLILARIYKRMSLIHEHTNHSRARDLLDQRTKYTEQAMDILTICGRISENKASVMIRRSCKEWSGFSALEIAERTPNITFFDHVQVRRVEQLLWYGRVNEQSSNYFALHLARLPFVGIIFFFLFYCAGCIQIHNNRAFRKETQSIQFYENHDEKWYYNFVRFYRSPKSVFAMNLYFYVVLLLLFSWFLMFNYCDYPTKLEMFLLIWIISMFIDEIRLEFLFKYFIQNKGGLQVG